MGIVYGKRSPSIHSPDMKEFFSTHHKFLYAMNIDTMPPVDLFPMLNWVPEYLVQWKKTVTDARISHEALYYRLLSTVRQRRAEGRGNGCFLEEALENSEEWGLTSNELLMSYLSFPFVWFDHSSYFSPPGTSAQCLSKVLTRRLPHCKIFFFVLWCSRKRKPRHGRKSTGS